MVRGDGKGWKVVRGDREGWKVVRGWEVSGEGWKVVTVITLVHRAKVVAATNRKFSSH